MDVVNVYLLAQALAGVAFLFSVSVLLLLVFLVAVIKWGESVAFACGSFYLLLVGFLAAPSLVMLHRLFLFLLV